MLTSLLIVAAVVAGGVSAVGQAQETPTRPAASPPLGRGEQDQPFGPVPPVDLKTPGSFPFTVEAPAAQAQPQVPPYYLTSVTLTGEVLGDRASINADVEVTVNVDSGWHRVPLRLNQAHIWAHEYVGPGEEAPAVSGASTEDGVVWLFRGTGLHKLRLSLWVPVRRSLAGRQLLLSLPPLPPQFEATLKLSVPEAPISIRVPKETTLLESADGENQTDILASIAGGRLDLLWQPATGNEATASQVLSTMNLRRNGSRVGLSVDQVMQFDQKSPRELHIRLPKDFQLVDVSGTNYQEHTLGSEGPQWCTVRFDEILTDRTDLRWLLEADLPSEGRSLALDGFEVRGAPRQDGVIRIEDFGLFDVRARSDRSQLVQRIDASSVRGGSPGTSLSAFSFPKQPFRLGLDITPIVPSFTVSPEHDLLVHAMDLELVSRFHVDVDSGAVQQFGLNWPLPAGEWVVDSVVLRAGSDEQPVSFTQAATSKLELALPVALTGAFEIELRTERQFNPDVPVEIKLPQMAANYRGAARVRVFPDDQLQTTVRPNPEKSFVPVAAAELPEPISGEVPQQQLRSTGTEGALLLEATVHERTVQAETALHVDELAPNNLVLSQQIDLDVRYGRVGYVVLVVPDELARLVPNEGWEFAMEVTADGRPLPAQRVSDGLLVTLPEAKKGRFSLQVRYRYPLDGPVAGAGGRQRIDVPLITVQGAESTGVRCQVHPLEAVQIEDAASWAAVQTSPDGAIWVAEQPDVSSVPLTISLNFADEAQQYSVEQAFLQTRFSDGGQVSTTAAFRLIMPPSHVVMRFPKDAELDEVQVDGETIPRDLLLRKAGSGGTEDAVTIPLHKSDAQSCILGMSFHSKLAAEFDLTQLIHADFPYFPSGVWTQETVWQIELPPNHHLFQSPRGLVPEFHWTRNGIFWRRTLSRSFLNVRQKWSQLAPNISSSTSERCYSFRQFGPIKAVQLRSMSRPLILLAGAGTMLLLGFVFWRLPWTRNVLSLVALSFLFALASLWYLEPMMLMLQPAAFGAFLAALATALDALRNPGRFAQGTVAAPLSADEPAWDKPGSSATHIPTTIYRPTQTSDSASAQR